MNWKDDLKQIIIGVPLLWLFLLLGGVFIYLMQAYYWVWLLLVFVVAPLAFKFIPDIYERYKDRSR